MASTGRAMPKFTKPPQGLVALFETLIADAPGVEKKKMFGYPAAFVAGQMCCGLFQDRMMMRLSETDREAFVAKYKARAFEPMPGRPMREYVEVPDRLIKDVTQLKEWLAKSMGYVSALPPKAVRAGKPGAARKK